MKATILDTLYTVVLFICAIAFVCMVFYVEHHIRTNMQTNKKTWSKAQVAKCRSLDGQPVLNQWMEFKACRLK